MRKITTKPALVLRQATLRDVPELVRQRRAMFEAMGEQDEQLLSKAGPDFARWMRRNYRAKQLVGFVINDGRGRVVAGGLVWLQERQPRPGFAGGGVPYLMSMYTEAEFRGQGLATRIIAAAIDWCRAQGHARLTLHASAAGESLYRKLGWKRSKEYVLRC